MESQRFTPEELEQLQKLIDRLERGA
jgi:hypothetical protein